MKNYYSDFATAQPDMSSLTSAMTKRTSDLMNSDWFNTQSPASQAPAQGQGQMQGNTTPQAPNAQNLQFGNDGYAANVPANLVKTESGGNWAAENDAYGSGGKGHFGALQFSRGRLQDAKNAGVIPQDMTPDQFMADPKAQVNTANWHFAEIDNRIYKNGLDKYLGSTVGGVPITMDSMRSMAHLGGFGGMSSFIHSSGMSNPSDVNGTSLAAYGTSHAYGGN